MPLDHLKSQAFLRDEFVDFENAHLNIASSPVLYGLAIYTVFNVNWNESDKKLYVFRLRDHFNRLVNSSRIMDFQEFIEKWDYERFESTMLELLKRNKVQEDALVRATVFVDEIVAGTRIHNLKNSLSAFVYPLGEILPRNGIDVCVSSWRRNTDNAIPARAKVNGGYINASLMKNEALLNGYDDAIAIDENGHVAEGTVANIFLARSGKLITPDGGTDILEGITRDTIIQFAKNLQIEVEVRPVDRSEVYIADELFFSGSSALITPILSVDKRPVASGKVGSLTSKFTKLYNDLRLGNSKQYSNWFTEVKL